MQMKKPFNFRPVVIAAVSLSLGIISACFFVMQNYFFAIFFTLLSVACCGVIFLPCYKEFSLKEKTVISVLCLLLFLSGGLGFGLTIDSYNNADLNGHYYSITAKVIEAEETDGGQRLILDDIYVKGNVAGKLRYKAYLYVLGNSNFDVGDVISFSASLNDRAMIYEGQLASTEISRRIKYTAEVYANEVTVSGYNLTVFEKINLFIRNSLKAGLDKDEFSVGYALLTGHSEYMDEEILSSFRLAGVAHIFSVSGLHIGFLAAVLGWVFNKLKVNRLIKAIIITLILFLYSGVCGFSSSSVRASVMTGVVLFASVKGARYDRLSSIAAAALIILLCAPIQLFTPGFQLSFAVVLAIAILATPIAKLFKFLPKIIANSLGVVLSAQLVSIPISLYWFGHFSIIAVLINLIFVPAVSVIYTVLFVAAILGGIFSIESALLFVPNYILKFVNMCITAFDYKIFIFGGFTLGALVVFYYLALLWLSGLFNSKRLIRTLISVVCCAVFLTGTVAINIAEKNSTSMFVCGSEKLCVTGIDAPTENVMIVSDAKTVYSTARLKRLSQKEDLTVLDTVVFTNGNDIEIQAFVTKLRTVFAIKRICYYGEKDEILEMALKKSFGSIKLVALSDGVDLQMKTFDCKFALGGRAVLLDINEKTVALFSKVDGVNYTSLQGDFDITVSGELSELIKAHYAPKRALSYRKTAGFVDGESQGTVKITL